MRALLLSLVLMAQTAAAVEVSEAEKNRVAELLEMQSLVEAGRLLDALVAKAPEDPDVLALKGYHAFLLGRYADAVTSLSRAQKERPSDKRIDASLDLAKRTREVTKKHKTVPTSRGHFVLSFLPGVDEALVPYADEALERAYDALGEVFRVRPEAPVRVEIYPRVQNLADVSPLKLSEIEASGTIALCKYNRLMIVSPRALVYGYPWLDTLAHEYTHYLVTLRSKNTVPIWLHEGFAKYFESRWRDEAAPSLAPTSEDLLAAAVKNGKLIPFEKMSPSMAKLPTQEDTSLAFAEVFMAMEFLYLKGGGGPVTGAGAVNALIDGMAEGRTDRQAIEAVTGKSFARFQDDWRAYLGARRLKTLPTHAQSRLLFRERTRAQDELKDLPEEETRQLVHLGDLLFMKGHFRAAAKEYEKGLKRAGGPNPIVSAKLASSLLKQGRHQRVREVVTPALALNSTHVLLYLYRGKATLALGDAAAASRDLEAAIGLNPFDPDVHALYAEALDKLGRSAEAERERRIQRLVRSE